MPTRWPLALPPSSRPFVPNGRVMRDRTPRRAPCAARMAAPGRKVTLDRLDQLDDFEQQSAGCGVGLDELEPQPIAQAERVAGALADQHLAALVVAEELLAERADGDQAVGAGAVQGGEQAKARDAGDAAGEGGADMRRHIGRDIT